MACALAALLLRPVRAEEGAQESAREQAEIGVRYYETGQYEPALQTFSAAYLRSARPILLLYMAHAHRQLKHHREAAALYERYLQADPSGKYRDEAWARLHEMRALLDVAAKERSGAGPAPPPAQPLPAAAPQSAPPLAPPPPAPSGPLAQRIVTGQQDRPPATRSRPRWPYYAGGAGLAAGLALVGWGLAGVLIQGQCTGDRALDPLESGGDPGCGRIYDSLPAGAVMVGVGAALSVGGIVLLAVSGRRRKAERSAVAAPLRGAVAIGGGP